jgi:hypothetical protein
MEIGVIHPKVDASLPTPKDTTDEHFLLHGMARYGTTIVEPA